MQSEAYKIFSETFGFLSIINLSNLKQRRIYQSLELLYKCLFCNGPSYIRDLFHFRKTKYSQRPRKHFESGGALTKRGTFVYDQNQTILWRSRAERKFLKICSLYNVGNGLYRVFTTAKRAFSFQKKRAFIQEILFSFFKWGI
jgi:hypothetical protein